MLVKRVVDITEINDSDNGELEGKTVLIPPVEVLNILLEPNVDDRETGPI